MKEKVSVMKTTKNKKEKLIENSVITIQSRNMLKIENTLKNRDKKMQNRKEWSEQNKEHLKEYRKQFFQ